MARLKRWIRDLLGFSSKETNGFIILIPLIAMVLFSQAIYTSIVQPKQADLAADQKKLDEIIAQWGLEEKNKKSQIDHPPKQKLFLFNPNNATLTDFNALGFSENLAKRIVHYRAKGGRFRIKSDLIKIYGMDSTFYSRLYTYITLPESLQGTDFKKENDRRPVFKKTKFNLNTADTSALKMINGIGPVLAKRIVKYRESLGGFIRSQQLNEVYGLDSAVINRILKDSYVQTDFMPKQLNINAASEVELDIHPYIDKRTAKVIVTYRFQHGKFKSVEEIRNVVVIKKELADKIIPYLKID
jgi:competence protein ComEA